MIDWFKRLFGDARIIIEGTTTDGKRFTSKGNVIGDFTEKELIEKAAEDVEFELGVSVARLRIVRWKGSSSNPITGRWYRRKQAG